MVVAMLAGAAAFPLSRGLGTARAQEISGGEAGTIQTKPVCSGTPTTDSLLYYDGTNWCGNVSPTITSLSLSGSTPLDFTDSSGDVTVEATKGLALKGNGTELDIGLNGLNDIDAKSQLRVLVGFTYALNGIDDVTNDYAPRMFFGGDWRSGDAGYSIAYFVPAQPIIFDNMTVAWSSYNCSTAPTYSLYDATTSTTIASFQLNAVGGGRSGAQTPASANVAKGDEVIAEQSLVGSCTTEPSVVAVGGTYYMQ